MNPEELAIAFVQVLLSFDHAPPLTLMTHDAESAALAISAVVERCAELQAGLDQITIGTGVFEELCLHDGTRLTHDEKPIICSRSNSSAT